MKKKIAIILAILLICISIAGIVQSSTDVLQVPKNMTLEEFKQILLNANQQTGFLAVTGANYWGLCSQECGLLFLGDCNPCKTGELASSCSWNPDYQSAITPFTSANAYCSQLFKPYTYYNRQCLCTTPAVQCSGGANTGDRKCEGSTVMQCQSGGVWGVVDSCQYGCSAGACQAQQCQPQTTKQCVGNNVYWYDSCENRGNIAQQCNSNEVCESNACKRIYTAGFVGEPFCSGNIVQQNYQNTDGSIETRTTQTCTSSQQCTNGVCVELACPTPAPDPSEWSQCTGGKISRISYTCDASTGYKYVPKTELQNCGCTSNTDCNSDETCSQSSFTCQKLQCAEGQIAQNNQCLTLGNSIQTIVIVVVAGIVFIAILITVLILAFRKGGKRK